MISWMMYQCLVNYTGAKPAEYYTVQKRPDYANYQKMVNIFVPGPRKELKTE
jgi:steroid 5-alpha reductase family enzyme